MKTLTHTTHCSRCVSNRMFYGAVVAMAGVVWCVVVLFGAEASDKGKSGITVLGAVAQFALAIGASAFAGGTVVAIADRIRHFFPRCPQCRRLLFRTSRDFRHAYYRCWRCDIRWSCDCGRVGSGGD